MQPFIWLSNCTEKSDRASFHNEKNVPNVERSAGGRHRRAMRFRRVRKEQ
jgi:hypothetical protein